MPIRFYVALLVGSFVVASCSAQSDVGSRDNPVAADLADVLKESLDAPTADLILTSDRVEAYLLKEWAKDPEGFHNAPVIEELEQMPDAEVDSLLNIIGNENSYQGKKSLKKCDFSPNLGFRFTRGQESTTILVALNCDMTKFVLVDGSGKKRDSDPAHAAFTALGQRLFPQTFEQTYNEEGLQNEPKVSFDAPEEPIDTPAVAPVPVDTTNQSDNGNQDH
jgi:hypothetical protein